MENKKKKKCAECGKEFYPYKTTDKYCSYKCASKHHKPLKRTPLNPVGFTPKIDEKKLAIRKEKWKKDAEKLRKRAEKKSAKNAFEAEFDKAKKKLKARLKKENDGKLCCEKCSTTYSIQFSVHHIIYRSEKPKHPLLNHQRNLIYLCYDCHEGFHNVKTSRNYLIQKRRLHELFERIWGYDSDVDYLGEQKTENQNDSQNT